MEKETMVRLPLPNTEGLLSLEATLRARRSRRSFSRQALTLIEVAQLLWAAQGITSRNGLRTAPSAGALYPLELFLEVGRVEQLAEGVYRYAPEDHALSEVSRAARRSELVIAGYGQGCIGQGAVNIVVAAVYGRTARKYGERRAVRYVQLEAGHAAQNVSLQAVALGLGTVVVGAFDDDLVREALLLADDVSPLAIMPVGRE